MDFLNGVRIQGYGPDASTYGQIQFIQRRTDASLRTVASIKSTGEFAIDGIAPSPIGSIDGQVLIGGGRVMVGGILSAKEIKVTTTGADYVFDDTYRLRPLTEVEQFIKDNRHLPEIPSAKVMQQDGMGVADIVTKQLAKIEELTLYAIQAERDKQALADKAEQLSDKAERLEKSLESVLARLAAVEGQLHQGK